MIIDLSWSQWEMSAKIAADLTIPLVSSLLGSQRLLGALDEHLDSRNATDAAFLLESESGKCLGAMKKQTKSMHGNVKQSKAI